MMTLDCYRKISQPGIFCSMAGSCSIKFMATNSTENLSAHKSLERINHGATPKLRKKPNKFSHSDPSLSIDVDRENSEILNFSQNSSLFGNFCSMAALESSCTSACTSILRSGSPLNFSKTVGFKRSLFYEADFFWQKLKKKTKKSTRVNSLLTFLCYFKTIPNPTPTREGHAAHRFRLHPDTILFYHEKLKNTLRKLNLKEILEPFLEKLVNINISLLRGKLWNI